MAHHYTTTHQTHKLKPRHVIGGTIVALLVLSGSWVMAASFAVTQGPTETGSGVYHGTSSLTYWTEATAGVSTQAATPPVLSTTVGTPTVLPGGGDELRDQRPRGQRHHALLEVHRGDHGPREH